MTWIAIAAAWLGGTGLGYVVRILLFEREIDKHFWDGYKRGVADERYRQAEAGRPLASRLTEGPLLFGVSLDELTKGKPTQ